MVEFLGGFTRNAFGFMISDTLFTEISHRTAELDSAQRAAAMAPDGGIVVRAGAGTGKTLTLVSRMTHLITDRGIAPESIMAVTFTNKAAGELRDRVADRLGSKIARRLSIGTFHALSAKILRRHADKFEMTRDFTIIDNDDIKRLVREAILACDLLDRKDYASDEEFDRAAAERAEAMSRQIRTWKSWGLTPNEITRAERPRRSEDEETGARVYVAYQDMLRERNNVDFGDIVLMATQILSIYPSIQIAESDRVRHLLVDEAQDANPVQVEWANRITQTHRNIFAVGDEDQSIFSFQSGYPEAIVHFAGGEAKARQYALVKNRRCTSQILAPAVTLVGHNRRSAPKLLESDRSGPPPTLQFCDNEHEEATFVASSISKLLKSGVKPEQCAILVRSSWVMGPIEEALIKAKIPHQIVGGGSLSDREEVKDITAYMKLARTPSDLLPFSRIVNRPARGLGPAAEMTLVDTWKSEKSAAFYAKCLSINKTANGPLPEIWREGFRSLGMHLQRLAEYGLSDNPIELIDFVLHEKGIGYQAFVEKEKDKKIRKRRLQSIEALKRIAREEANLTDFLQSVALEENDHKDDAIARVRLSTMHSAKGLEWDHVFCPAFDSGVIPSSQAWRSTRAGTPGDVWDGPRGGGIDEERRLAHVAFTRARQTLTVSSSAIRNGQKCGPSIFLPESGLEAILSVDAYELSRMNSKHTGRLSERSGRKGFVREGKGKYC